MAKFSETFGLNGNQALFDFVDIELNTDNPVYLDPYAIQIKNDEWSIRAGDYIRSFFTALLDALRDNNEQRATHLLQNLHEPNETRFGVSEGEPNGRAIAEKKAESLAQAIRESRAFETGIMADVSEAELFIKYVGSDTISDLVTNVLRGMLVEYTQAQCVLHNVETENVHDIGPVWSINDRDWQAIPLQLPSHQGLPILLVPKFSVRRKLTLNSQEFWNHHMTHFLQQEYLNSGSALVQTLKNGTRRVTKKDVQARHPFIKNNLAEFVSKHPQVLATYKRLKGAEGPLSNEELKLILDEEYFDERVYAQTLIDELANIAPGNDNASSFHNFIMGVCTFLFYPKMSCPVKEHEIHEGRKRIDFKYTNAATNGFFFRMLENPNTRSIDIPFECKNYSKEVANPEMDQLSGRFSIHRGKLGFLLCREIDNRERFIQRCRDTALDGRGYIIVFEDIDIINMLNIVKTGTRTRINQYLQNRFDELTN